MNKRLSEVVRIELEDFDGLSKDETELLARRLAVLANAAILKRDKFVERRKYPRIQTDIPVVVSV